VITAYGDAMTDLVVDFIGAAPGGGLPILLAHRRWPSTYDPR